VFLNVPFDKGYERLFVGLIAAVVGLGWTPRCVLEIAETGQGRLRRLLDIIVACGVSVHDLSRVGAPARFNMPFELGLACAISELNDRKHDYLLLERVQHRLTRTLSDLNGRDPYIHGNSSQQLIIQVLNVLKPATGTPDVEAILKLDRRLWTAVRLLKSTYRAETMFSSAALYEATVISATRLATEAGLIQP
jgi:hypothetical protein